MSLRWQSCANQPLPACAGANGRTQASRAAARASRRIDRDRAVIGAGIGRRIRRGSLRFRGGLRLGFRLLALALLFVTTQLVGTLLFGALLLFQALLFALRFGQLGLRLLLLLALLLLAFLLLLALLLLGLLLLLRLLALALLLLATIATLFVATPLALLLLCMALSWLPKTATGIPFHDGPGLAPGWNNLALPLSYVPALCMAALSIAARSAGRRAQP